MRIRHSLVVAGLIAAVPVVAPAAPALATAPTSIGLTSTTLDTGGEAWGVAIADVTGDGLPDLIVTNHGSSDASLGFKVLVYAQQLDGSLASSPAVYSPSAAPTGTDSWLFPAVGDVNGDGLPDVVVGHESGLDVLPKTSSLSLKATPSTIAPSEQTTLAATLIGGEPGRAVSFFDMSGGTKTFIATVSVNIHDKALILVSPATTRTYRVEFAGDAIWTSAFATTKVTVQKKATSLSLSASDPSIVYGKKTNLVATLKGGDGVRKVSFYAVTGTGKKLLGTVVVNSQNKAVFTVAPTKNTSYFATYQGSTVWAAATSNTQKVSVQVIVTGKMTRYRYKDGSYAVYDCCRAFYWFTVKPAHPYGKVVVTIDYLANGSWHNLGSKAFQLRKDGTDEIFIDVTGAKGLRLRVRSQFKSDADHVGAISAYSFFRYV